MAWLTAIPVIGDFIKNVLDFASKRWGYNPTQQEIEKLSQDILSESNILETLRKFYEVIIEYEGKAEVVPKLVLYLRCTWRPALQWGLTVKVLWALFLQGKSVEEMQWTISFVAGLAVVRELGKRINNNKS